MANCISATLFGHAQLRDGAGRLAAGSCCASRTSTSAAAGANTKEAILADSRLAWPRMEGAGAPAIRHFEDYAEALDRLIEEGLVFRPS